MRPVTALKLLRASLKLRGLRGTAALLLRLVTQRRTLRETLRKDRAFDEERGVDTASWVHVPELDTTSSNLRHAMRYQPSSAEEFALLMTKLQINHADYTFVDYGSGKGRVLLLAAELPFRRIIGVEFAESLDRIARQNIATLSEPAGRISTFVLDATEFDVPSDPLVLYFFSPFGPPVLRRVLDRLKTSLEREPRPAYAVVIGPPNLARTVEESGFLPMDVEELGWRTRGIFVAQPTANRRARPRSPVLPHLQSPASPSSGSSRSPSSAAPRGSGRGREP